MSKLDEIRKEIENLTYHPESMGCGLEDCMITDRYEACEYGWNEAIEAVMEVINNYEDHDDTDVSMKCNNCSRRKWYMLGYEDAVKEEPGVAKEFLKQCKQIVKKYEKNYSGWISLEERMPTKEECENDYFWLMFKYNTSPVVARCCWVESEDENGNDDSFSEFFIDQYPQMYIPSKSNIIAWRIVGVPKPYYTERSDGYDGE